MGSFEILEHTADVGIEARGHDLKEVFLQASRGLFEILGAWDPGPGQRVPIELTAADPGALLVDWLSELIYLQETRDAVFRDVGFENVAPGILKGWVDLGPRTSELEGTAVKAATYHRLSVERAGETWLARVYLDV